MRNRVSFAERDSSGAAITLLVKSSTRRGRTQTRKKRSAAWQVMFEIQAWRLKDPPASAAGGHCRVRGPIAKRLAWK